MHSTIQVSQKLRETLQDMKKNAKESYEELIWDLLEDRMELSAQTKKDIAKAEADIKAGRFVAHEQVKKDLGLI